MPAGNCHGIYLAAFFFIDVCLCIAMIFGTDDGKTSPVDDQNSLQKSNGLIRA